MDTRTPADLQPAPVGQDVALWQALRPGYCQRWSVCPEMAGSEVHAAHAARVARILLWCWPDVPAAALAWAVTHDDGEMGLGDMAGDFKRRNPTLAVALDKAEAKNRDALGIPRVYLPPSIELLCDLADKLAGLYHVRQLRPSLLYDGLFQEDLIHMRGRLSAILARSSAPIRALRAAFETDFQQWLEDMV